jgi:hypothetical protein
MCHFLSMNCKDFVLHKETKRVSEHGSNSIIKARVFLANLEHQGWLQLS